MSDFFERAADLRHLKATLKIHPMDRAKVDGVLGYTMVVCTHAYHGIEVFYFDVEQWSDCFMSVTNDLWVNGYTINCQLMQ